jgi:glucose/arabinose dehydrogenase
MSGSGRGLLAGCVVAGLLASACASFTGQPPPESWQAQQTLTPQAGPDPQMPGDGGLPGEGGGNRQPPSSIPPPDGCLDFNPAVIGTCLDTVSAVAALPGTDSDPAAYVGERRTGRILLVRRGVEPTLVGTLAVDGGTDGGLTGLALSPSYTEDQLLFAYVTTATDNRLVRLAPGDSPKPVLTGIPRGATGNRGALSLDHRGALLLATGDAGDPAAPADPRSLAGKVLRLTSGGKPAEGNPQPGSMVVASGVHSPGGVCSSLDGARMWMTDRASSRDVLYRLDPGRPLAEPAWSWPDRPGVAGCVSTADSVWVAMTVAGHLQALPMAQDGSFSGKPNIIMADQDGFGRLGAIDLVHNGLAIAGTVNKDGGAPVSSDDRAVVIVPSGGLGGGPD